MIMKVTLWIKVIVIWMKMRLNNGPQMTAKNQTKPKKLFKKPPKIIKTNQFKVFPSQTMMKLRTLTTWRARKSTNRQTNKSIQLYSVSTRNVRKTKTQILTNLRAKQKNLSIAQTKSKWLDNPILSKESTTSATDSFDDSNLATSQWRIVWNLSIRRYLSLNFLLNWSNWTYFILFACLFL